MFAHHENVKNTLDILSVMATIGAFLQMFTPVFGLIGAIWTLMRIVEMVAGKPFAQVIRGGKNNASD